MSSVYIMTVNTDEKIAMQRDEIACKDHTTRTLNQISNLDILTPNPTLITTKSA